MSTMTSERELLSSYLDDGGWHTEAENVRNGVDLDSYEIELRLIDWLHRHTHLAQPAEAVDVGSIREVHDALLDHFIAANVDGTPYPHVSAEDLGDWCEVLAHCISTRTRREAIDADAIKKVAEEAAVLATWETVQLSSVQLQAWADKLVRSISGEKVGPVDDGPVFFAVLNEAGNEGFITTDRDDAEYAAEGISHGFGVSSLADAFRESYAPDGDESFAVLTLPAFPAPDKER